MLREAVHRRVFLASGWTDRSRRWTHRVDGFVLCAQKLAISLPSVIAPAALTRRTLSLNNREKMHVVETAIAGSRRPSKVYTW